MEVDEQDGAAQSQLESSPKPQTSPRSMSEKQEQQVVETLTPSIVPPEDEQPGGFMKEADEEKERTQQAREDSLTVPRDTSRLSPSRLVNGTPEASTSILTPAKSKNSLNLAVTPASRGAAAKAVTPIDTRLDGRIGAPSPRSDPPPTPPTRLASSSIKRRSSRSPNNAPLASSTALQDVLSSPSSSPLPLPLPVASTSSSPGPSSPGATSSSMKRSPSSPTRSSNDVFGSRPAENSKRMRSSSPPIETSPPHARSSPSLQKSRRSTSPSDSNTAAVNSLSPSRSSSPPIPGTELLEQDANKAETSSSPTHPGSPSLSSSSSPQRVQQIPRRVKVYALHETNWIDLGTGACTYHRGVARRVPRKPAEDPEQGQDKATSEGQPDKKPALSIVGRASRDVAKEQKEEAASIELIDLDEEEVQLADNEEEAAWIEIVKESRWKSDLKTKVRKGAGKSATTKSAAAVDGTASADSTAETEVSADDDDWERIWTSRIEKPDLTSHGYDMDAFVPHMGGDDGEEVIGRYRRQQDTLIVWKSMTSETELALSFAATNGCTEVWHFLLAVHRRWEVQCLEAQEAEQQQYLEESQKPGRRHSLLYELTHNTTGAGLLPDPSLGNLEEIDKIIKAVGRTAVGREKLSSYIGRTNFINKLFPIFSQAEDLESLPDLHTICGIMHDILNLNDHGLWEFILADDIFLDVIGLLEYDPDFPTMKASYRSHLADPSLYVEVVPIEDEDVKEKIHQIYRLQYIKDVIMPRALDDGAFQIINSIIYFCQVDVVQTLSETESFWRQLLNETFPESDTSKPPNGEVKQQSSNGAGLSLIDKQQDAIAFLQSYVQTAKQLQPLMRYHAFRILAERGLLRVLEYALSHPKLRDVQAVRVAIVEVLMLLVDNDPASIRAFVLKGQDKSGKHRNLMLAIIEAFHREDDLGIKAILAEAIRILLLPPGESSAAETAAARARPDDPNVDKFLQNFYETGVTQLLEPITKMVVPISEGFWEPSPAKVALFTHLCDLLCFFVTQHSFRSKFFILSSAVTNKMAALLQAKPKHIRLGALRFFRACIGRSDDFYNRYLVKNNALPPILELTRQEAPHNNLLSSACMELFEYLRLNSQQNSSAKILTKELMTKHEDMVKEMSTAVPVFQGLLMKWDVLNEPPPPPDAPTSDGDTVIDTSQAHLEPPIAPSQRDERSLTAEEEDYFNTEDDDDELEEGPQPLPRSTTSGDTSATSTVPQKRQEAAHEANDTGEDGFSRKRRRLSVPSLASEGSGVTLSSDIAADSPALSFGNDEPHAQLSQPDTDSESELVRIREKRKRAEDEEDDDDFLLAKKSQAEKDNKPSNGSLSGKSKNVSGKLKLFFGKKS